MPSREYAYYLKGNKLCIVEKDGTAGEEILNDDGSSTGTYKRASGTGDWKSPLATEADALRIEYTYVPIYLIERTNLTHTDLVKYRSNENGKLHIKGPDGTNYDTTMDAGNYIVLENAGRFNGLQKIDSFTSEDGTNDAIVLETTYSGTQASWTNFEQTPTLYYDVSVLQVAGEDFDLDIPTYLEEAIIYYMKARLAEDSQAIEQREYYMNLFKKRLESHNNSRVWGARILASGPHAIR